MIKCLMGKELLRLNMNKMRNIGPLHSLAAKA